MTAIVVVTTGLAGLGLTGVASASTARVAAPAFVTNTQICTIQSFDGHYLSAIGGGGRTTDVIETNRTVASTWETFTMVISGVWHGADWGFIIWGALHAVGRCLCDLTSRLLARARCE
jgi:hypothetical protein